MKDWFTIAWRDEKVVLLDQRELPEREVYLDQKEAALDEAQRRLDNERGDFDNPRVETTVSGLRSGGLLTSTTVFN